MPCAAGRATQGRDSTRLPTATDTRQSFALPRNRSQTPCATGASPYFPGRRLQLQRRDPAECTATVSTLIRLPSIQKRGPSALVQKLTHPDNGTWDGASQRD